MSTDSWIPGGSSRRLSNESSNWRVEAVHHNVVGVVLRTCMRLCDSISDGG